MKQAEDKMPNMVGRCGNLATVHQCQESGKFFYLVCLTLVETRHVETLNKNCPSGQVFSMEKMAGQDKRRLKQLKTMNMFQT